MSATALLYMPLAREELATPRPNGQTAASFRRAELIRNLPALRDHISREWCPVHRRYARELTQFDSLERASSPAALAKMCPNPGTSGYSCNILRIWRTLVPAVVSGMRALGVWPAWGGGSEGNGMSLYTCAALREECMHTACTHTICTPHAHRICTPHMHTACTQHAHTACARMPAAYTPLVPTGSESSLATHSTSTGTSTQLPSFSGSTPSQACPPKSRAR